MGRMAARKVDIDNEEVQAELRDFMAARGSHMENSSMPALANATAEGQAVTEETEEDGTFKSLVWAIMNCPTCKGKDTVACFRTCRYGGKLDEAKKQHTWSECLNKCISNRWLRATFSAML